mmetsp:Transcript_20331/g.51343  ORF Transcript_20331/g.51343 Transcript_20331/m.51343 type:complete len:106 (-) Transcript_20331:6-323(-)
MRAAVVPVRRAASMGAVFAAAWLANPAAATRPFLRRGRSDSGVAAHDLSTLSPLLSRKISPDAQLDLAAMQLEEVPAGAEDDAAGRHGLTLMKADKLSTTVGTTK